MIRIGCYIFVALIVIALLILAFGPFLLGMMDKSQNRGGADHE
jgi:hypothetical protein